MVVAQAPIEGFDLTEAEELLSRTCIALQRWKTPVKEYVLTQYIGTKKRRLNATRTRQLVEFGVERGLLKAWTMPDPNSPSRITKMVGLLGQSTHVEHRRPRPVSNWDTQYPITDVPATRTRLQIVQDTIQRQYAELSQESKEEIIALLTDPDPNRPSTADVARAYGVHAGTIGMVKREFGLTTYTHRGTRKPPKVTPPVIQTPKPVVPQPTEDILDIITRKLQAATAAQECSNAFTITTITEFTVEADSAEEAMAKVKSHEGVSDIISIRKARA